MRTIDHLILAFMVLLGVLSMSAAGCQVLGPAQAAAQDLVSEDIVVEYEPSTGDEPAPAIVWDDATRLALGQCLVAEARWRNRTEHSAIAHVLERRWRARLAAEPGVTFETIVRRYCHVHRVARERSSNGWALDLPWGPMVEDPGMGPTVNWMQWRDDWDYTRETVELFERGELRDPMPLAVHFGGAMDSAAPSLVYLGPRTRSLEDGREILLFNRFYARRSALERAARRIR